MSILQSLSEPFPSEVERELKKGNARLTYIPVSEVITRLNKVLGVDMWSYEIINCGRDTLDPDYVVAQVRLTVNFVPTDTAPNITITRDGIGGQKIKRTRNGDIVDLGDEMKGAVSDALKKAAQSLGVGIYLARSEEALYLEHAEEIADHPVSQDHFEKLREILNSLDQETAVKCKSYWSKISDNKEFTNENVTADLLQKVLAYVKAHRSAEAAA